MKFAGGLPSRVDKLVEAAQAEDWFEMRHLAEYMIRSSDAYGRADISACAKQMCDEMDKPDNRLGIQQSLIRLIGACGSAPDAPPQRTRSHKRNSEKPVG
jgi:hypothetical protein